MKINFLYLLVPLVLALSLAIRNAVQLWIQNKILREVVQLLIILSRSCKNKSEDCPVQGAATRVLSDLIQVKPVKLHMTWLHHLQSIATKTSKLKNEDRTKE